MNSYGGLSAPVAAGVLVLFCLALGLFMGIFAALLGALAGPGRLGRKAVLFAPVLWVAVELFRGYAVDFPWNQLGTVLVDNIALSRLASVTGVYGLSFEILLINVVFAMAFLIPRRQGRLLLWASRSGGRSAAGRRAVRSSAAQLRIVPRDWCRPMYPFWKRTAGPGTTFSKPSLPCQT